MEEYVEGADTGGLLWSADGTVSGADWSGQML